MSTPRADSKIQPWAPHHCAGGEAQFEFSSPDNGDTGALIVAAVCFSIPICIGLIFWAVFS